MRHQLQTAKNSGDRLRALLELGNGYLFRPKQNKEDIDSALQFARQAKLLSYKLHDKNGVDEAVLLTAGCHAEALDYNTAKKQLLYLQGIKRIILLTYLGDQYYFKTFHSDPPDLIMLDTAVIYYHQKLVVSKASRSEKHIQQAIEQLEHCISIYIDHNRFESVTKQTAWLRDHTKGTNTRAPAPKTFGLIAQKHIHNGDYEKALNATLNALKLLNDRSPDHQKAWVYTQAGHTYRLIGNFDKSNFYYLKLLEAPEKYTLSAVYGIVGNVYHNYRKLHQTDRGFQFILAFQKRSPAKSREDSIYLYRTLGQHYNATDQLDLAEKNFLQAIAISETTKKPQSAIYSYLGGVYLRKKNFKKAIEAYQKCEALARGQHQGFLTSLYSARSRADSMAGNFRSAYTYLAKSKAIDDSIYNVSKEKHTQELDIQYETQKKEAQLTERANFIRFLNQKNSLQKQNAKLQLSKLEQAQQLAANNQAIVNLKVRDLTLKNKDLRSVSQIAELQRTQLDQADLNKKITAAIILLLLVIIALVYRQFRHNRQITRVVTSKNEQLNELLIEKEWLLKEVHHRVKNNLQTIVNLLESQSDHLDEAAFTAIETSKNRIFAMSLIHQKLYLSEKSSTVDMSAYINELALFLRDTFSAGAIIFRIDADPIKLDAERSIPIGLIINEIVTNSLKHAFPGDRKGTIVIRFKKSATDLCSLSITDDGVGFPYHRISKEASTMGIKLIKGLARQLDGELSVNCNAGTSFVISAIAMTNHQLVEK